MYILLLISIIVGGDVHVSSVSLSANKTQCFNELKRIKSMIEQDERDGNIVGVEKISARCEYVQINKESFN